MPLEMVIVAKAKEMQQNPAGGSFRQPVDGPSRRRLPDALALPTLRV
jgi:hypothetical protein